MNPDWKSVGKTLCSITGAALAGPTGALLGSFAGGLLGTVLPGASGFASSVLSTLATKAIANTGTALAARLTPVEKQRINHDLQTAFRDAFGEAIYDLGGECCFAQIWKERPRDVPTTAIYPLTPQAHQLWQQDSPLARQACDCFHDMHRALAQQTILPLDPPPDQPAASVYRYLEADTPQALADAFFDQVLAPFLADYHTLRAELPGFEAHLRRHLLDRTLVHLGELLKARTPAWRAFNRLMLEGLRDQVQEVSAGQAEIVERLDALLARPEAQGVAVWATGLADLLAATGQIEKRMDEGFDAVLGRVVAQHGEVLARFDWLIAAAGRIETKVDRVLRFLEDGRWVVEGAPPIYAAEPPAPGEPPFKGLQHFDIADAEMFFGRERLTARLVGQLRRQRLLVVVGASGSGKSSLVRAGVLPALQRHEPLADGSFPPTGSARWPVHIITPTAHPLEALAASLTRDSASVAATTALVQDLSADPHSLDLAVRKQLSAPDRQGAEHLLLVVDQFEELFTQCRDDAERRAFVDNLLTAVSPSSAGAAACEGEGPLVLILVLRADFYAHCGQFANLREALARRQEYIGPMNPEELRRAIEEPARRAGWEFERGLVDLIVRDVGDEPGALPLLSHALLETWRHRRGRVMTLESYAEAGGVRGAIAKTAETLYTHDLGPEQQTIARNIFLRLTEPGEGTQDTRRRATLAELVPHSEDAPAVADVLQKLVEARLVTTSQGPLLSGAEAPAPSGAEATVEVAHEALIREWPTLRRWLDEDREGLRLHRQLTAVAEEWARLGKDTGVVYRGVRLAQAIEWAEQHDDQLSQREREFLAFSRYIAERDAAAREAQRQRELEAARKLAEAEKRRAEEQAHAAKRLRQRALLLAGALLVAGILAVVALLFGQQARQNAEAAQAASTLAVAQQVTAEAASTLAVAEADSRATARAEALGQKATAEAASTRSVAEADTRATAEADALRQKATAEAASAEAQRQSRISLARELAAQSSSLLERDVDLGLLLAVQAVRISQNLAGAPIPETQSALYHALQGASFDRVLRGHQGQVWTAVFSPDGSLIVTAAEDGTARLWRADGTLLATLEGHRDSLTAALFSPGAELHDGSRIVTASLDGTARLWRGDGSLVAVLEGHAGGVLGASFSPDGSRVITFGMDGTARLWTADGALVTTLEGHGGPVMAAAFSPDGRRIVTASSDTTARLWTAEGTLLTTLPGHTGWVGSAVFSPDGSRLLTASYDGTARLWTAEGTLLAVLKGHEGAVYSALFQPGGSHILTASDDGTARLWADDGTFLTALEGHSGPLFSAFYSPDGSRILTASSDATARLWTADGTLISSLKGHVDSVNLATFSPDGAWIVTAGADNTARLWSVGQTYLAVLRGHRGPVACAAYSPDGQWIASGALDNTARLWRADGTFVLALEGHRGAVVGVGWSPDGSRLATASNDGTARLWTTDGAQVGVLTGHTAPVRSADFSADGQWLVTASEDGTARLWTADGAFVRALEGHTAAVWSARFSPDSQWIVTASDDGTAGLWRTDGAPSAMANGAFVRALEGHEGPVWYASFSPDGQMIATASSDSTARLWRLDGTPLLTLAGHSDAVTSVDFSPGMEPGDSLLIATTSHDGTARLWRADGALIAVLEGHTTWVSSGQFRPGARPGNGSRLLTASWDGTVRQWGVYGDVPDMLAEAERRVGRSLAQEECQRYLHQPACPPAP